MAEALTKPSRRIRNMVAKELRLIVKDKVALLLIFLLPAALIGMLWWVTDMSDMGGFGFGGGGDNGGGMGDNETSFSSGVVLGVIDLDTTRVYEGEDLSNNFTAYLNLSAEVIMYNSTEEAFDDLYEQRIQGYVVIPDGFEANLTDNEPTYVDVHIDGTDFLTEASVQGVIQTATILFRAGKLWIRSEVFPGIVIEFTPQGGYLESVFGGFIVIFSSYLGIAMTSAQSIVGDTPLRRMLLTPTSRLEVVVAKVLGYVIIGFFQSLLLITLWVLAFGLILNTSFFALVIIMSLSSLTGSSTGILISAVAGTRLQANQMFLFVLFGTLILSGFFIDVGALDGILPMNQGLNLLIDTAFKGLSLLQVIDRVLILLAFSVFAMLAATFIFARKPTLG
ncbi:ABC transporter permease [Candidatus Thorarchaeota archaeon]|jgi:ABC-2 type transport system permease protein|nr:MAG: ABC transporter permease [Candidatus Thorarchaeota archaeon]